MVTCHVGWSFRDRWADTYVLIHTWSLYIDPARVLLSVRYRLFPMCIWKSVPVSPYYQAVRMLSCKEVFYMADLPCFLKPDNCQRPSRNFRMWNDSTSTRLEHMGAFSLLCTQINRFYFQQCLISSYLCRCIQCNSVAALFKNVTHYVNGRSVAAWVAFGRAILVII